MPSPVPVPTGAACGSASRESSAKRLPASKGGHSVKVFGRFRPLEMGANPAGWDLQGNVLHLVPDAGALPAAGNGQQFTCAMDAVFTEEATQREVYEVTTRPGVMDVLNGINASVFAYGQTGTGKTFSMYGPDEVLHGISTEQREEWGCALHAIDQIWDARNHRDQVRIDASLLEVYNDMINDLAPGACGGPNGDGRDLKLREGVEGVFVDGLTECDVGSTDQVYELLTAGNRQRQVGATLVNSRSSRSHTVFVIGLTQLLSDQVGGREERLLTSKLNLVDLAGSERAAATEALEGGRVEEGRRINLSLTCLGMCINALATAPRGVSIHVPYRNSKLTHLLQDSIGGNCKTAMLFSLSPATFRLEETLSTMRFAMRAKKIHVAAKVNERKIERPPPPRQPTINVLRNARDADATAVTSPEPHTLRHVSSAAPPAKEKGRRASRASCRTVCHEPRAELRPAWAAGAPAPAQAWPELAGGRAEPDRDRATDDHASAVAQERRAGRAREAALCATIGELEAKLEASEKVRAQKEGSGCLCALVAADGALSLLGRKGGGGGSVSRAPSPRCH